MSFKFIQNKSIDKYKNKSIIAEIDGLKLALINNGKPKLIINDTSLKIREGEILGIIGESGSGKTVITTTFTGLNADFQKALAGTIKLKDQDVTHWKSEQWQESKLRGRFVSQVFQNPLSSLNPYRTIGSQIIESIQINSDVKVSKEEAYSIALDLLDSVKVNDPVEIMKMYPHQMSGGMNQRIVIVTVLAAKPKLIIFDEPTTALDPVVQAQIIEIIRQINKKTKTTIIIITHDIALVSSIADSICIMYAGKIVEKGLTEEIVEYPLHPYTWGLLNSIPSGSHKHELYTIPGVVPSDISKIKGDAFAPRNDFALEIDFIISPPEFKVTDTHYVRSWLYDDRAPKFTPPKLIQDKWNAWEAKNIKDIK